MKQLTNEERAKIYRQAAEMVFNNEGVLGTKAYGCHVLSLITGDNVKSYNLETSFPEYGLFTPDGITYAFWMWHEYQERTLGFLLAEQIALNP